MGKSVYNEVTPVLKLSKHKKTSREKTDSPYLLRSGSPSALSAQSMTTAAATTSSLAYAGNSPSIDPTKWPGSLTRFVNDSFVRSNQLNDADKAIFNHQLLALIAQAADQGKVWENNWSIQKVPVLDGGPAAVQLECNSRVQTVNDWPPALIALGKRCLDKAATLNDSKRTQLNGHLETLVLMAQTQGKMLVNDWTRQKVPILDKSCKEVELECNLPKVLPKVTGDNGTDFDSVTRKRQRMERFSSPLATPEASKKPKSRTSNGTFVGHCTDLEKNYLRLTSESDPAKVRPEHVLVKSMEHVLRRYRSEGAPYSYLNTQFKSIRQDLTVQHIKSDLTLRVYEAHARIAIENNDLGEFNQCQSQLKYLYFTKKKLLGDRLSGDFYDLELEFTCYRILYMLMTGNHSEIYKIKYEVYFNEAELQKLRQSAVFASVENSFELHHCQIVGGYHQFFSIYNTFNTENKLPLACHLIKHFLLKKERVKALNIILKAYRKIAVPFLTSELKFDSEDDFSAFLKGHKLLQFVTNTSEFDCVASRAVIQSITVDTGFRKIDIKGQI